MAAMVSAGPAEGPYPGMVPASPFGVVAAGPRRAKPAPCRPLCHERYILARQTSGGANLEVAARGRPGHGRGASPGASGGLA